jgi:hypothetical protein
VKSAEDEDAYIRFYRLMRFMFDKLEMADSGEQREFLTSFIFAKNTKPNSSEFIKIIADVASGGALFKEVLMRKIYTDVSQGRHSRDYFSVLKDLSNNISDAGLKQQLEMLTKIFPNKDEKKAFNTYLMMQLGGFIDAEDMSQEYIYEEIASPERYVPGVLRVAPELSLESIRNVMKSAPAGLDKNDPMLRLAEILDEAMSLQGLNLDRFKKFESILRNQLAEQDAVDSFGLLEKLLVTIVTAEHEPADALVADTLLEKIDKEGFGKFIYYNENPQQLIFDVIEMQKIATNRQAPLESMSRVTDCYAVVASISDDASFGQRALSLNEFMNILRTASPEDKLKQEYISLERDFRNFELVLLDPTGSGLNEKTVVEFIGPLHLSGELNRILKSVQGMVAQGAQNYLSSGLVLSPFASSISSWISDMLATSKKYDLFQAQLRDPLVALFKGISMEETLNFALHNSKDEILGDTRLSFAIFRYVEANDIQEAKAFFRNVLGAKKEILRVAYLTYKQGGTLNYSSVIGNICEQRRIPPEIAKILEVYTTDLIKTKIEQLQKLAPRAQEAVLASWQMEMLQELPLELLGIVDRLVVHPYFTNAQTKELSPAQVKAILTKNIDVQRCLARLTECGIPQKIQDEIVDKACNLAVVKMKEFDVIKGFGEAEEEFKRDWYNEISSSMHPIQTPLEKVLVEPLVEILKPFILDPVVQLLRQQWVSRKAALVSSIFTSNDPVESLIRGYVGDALTKVLTKGLAYGTNLKVDGLTLLTLIESKIPGKDAPKPQAPTTVKQSQSPIEARETEAVKTVQTLIREMLSIGLEQVSNENDRVLKASSLLVGFLSPIAPWFTNSFVKSALTKQSDAEFSDILADVLHASLPPPFPDAQDQAKFEATFKDHLKWLIENKPNLGMDGEQGNAIRSEFMVRVKALKTMVRTCEYDYDAEMYEEYRQKIKYDPIVRRFVSRKTSESFINKTDGIIQTKMRETKIPILPRLAPFAEGITHSIPDYLDNDLFDVELKYMLKRLVIQTLVEQLEKSAAKMKL